MVENFNRPLKFRGCSKKRQKSINLMLEIYQSWFITSNLLEKGWWKGWLKFRILVAHVQDEKIAYWLLKSKISVNFRLWMTELNTKYPPPFPPPFLSGPIFQTYTHKAFWGWKRLVCRVISWFFNIKNIFIRKKQLNLTESGSQKSVGVSRNGHFVRR